MRQVLPRGTVTFKEKLSSVLLRCAAGPWLLSPGTQPHLTTLPRLLGQLGKGCVSQGQGCIFISEFTAHTLSDSPELLYDVLSLGSKMLTSVKHHA